MEHYFIIKLKMGCPEGRTEHGRPVCPVQGFRTLVYESADVLTCGDRGDNKGLLKLILG